MRTTYCVGVPLTIEVDDDGTVTFEVDLSDVDLAYDADLEERGYPSAVIAADQTHVSEAVRSLQYTHQFPTA